MPDREENRKNNLVLHFHSGIVIRILIFFILVLGTTVVLRPLQLNIRARMEKLKEDFIRETESYLGRKIQYSGMGPSIFGVLDIRDIQILRDDDSVFLSIARLRLSYSILELLKGNRLNAFYSVRVDRPILSFDFIKDSDLWERLASLRNQDSKKSPEESVRILRDLLPQRFTLRIWNGEWEISDSLASLKIEGVNIDASSRQNRFAFQGRWNAKAVSPLLEASMNGRITGEYSEDLDEGAATITIPSLSGNNFRLRPLGFNFRLAGNKLEIRKVYDRSPLAFSLFYDFESANLSGRLEAENFSPGNLITLTGAAREQNKNLDIRISGQTEFEMDRFGSFAFNMDFSGSGRENSFLEQASLQIEILGDTERITVNNFDFNSSLGDLAFKGGINFAKPAGSLDEDYIKMSFDSIAPYGTLTLSDFRLYGNDGVSGDLYINTFEREINIFSENLSADGVGLSALNMVFYREKHRLNFALYILRFNEIRPGGISSWDDVRICTLELEGSSDYDPAQVQANLRLNSFSIGDILSFVEPFVPRAIMPSFFRSAADNLYLTTEIFFNTDYVHMLYNAPRIVAVYEGLLDVLATASLSGTDRGIELTSSRISWESGTLEFSGNMDFSDSDDISFSIGASLRNLNYFFEGAILERKNILVRGSYGIEALLAMGETDVLTGYLKGDMIPLPSGDRVASLSFYLSILYDSPLYWQTTIEKFDLAGLSTPSSSSALLRFTGEISNRGCSIPAIVFDDGRGALGGEIAANWNPSFDNCNFKAEISSGNRYEIYGLNGTYIDKRLDLFVSGQRMQFSRFTSINAVADGSIQLYWESPLSFNAEIVLPLFDLYTQNGIVHSSAFATLDNDEFNAKNINIEYSGIEVSIPNIKIDRVLSIAETKGLIWGYVSDKLIDISLSADAVFTNAATWLDLAREMTFINASLSFNSANIGGITAEEPFKFLFNYQKEDFGYAVSLNGGPRDMLRFRYAPETKGGGVFTAALSAPSPFRGTVTGYFSRETIDARVGDLYVDLGSLWRFIPSSDVISFPGGIVTGSIRIGGSPSDPEFYGTARGTSVQILVPQFIPEPIRPAPTIFTFDRNEITFGPINAVVGQGGGKASGWFRFDQWIPNIFSIDIQVPQQSPIPYKFDIVGVLADGLVSGKLNLGLEDMILSITGDLIAQETAISLDANELVSLEGQSTFGSDSAKISVVTDISVRAGRRVEFFWPSYDFPIIQANLDLGTAIYLTSDATDRRFTFNGDVVLRGGEIFYLERNFYIREGTLFFRENETQFDPRISARAEIRDRADIGPVTISMIIDNAPLKSFEPRFVSNPPLSQLEIYSILGQYPQGNGEQRNLATSAVIDSLAQFTVIQKLQRQVRNFLGLDMLSMRTQLLQNVVIQATGYQFSNVPVERSNRFGNYFDNTTIFIGKYFGSELFGEAMLSFRYDENKTEWGGLVLEPEFGFEMQNPLFNIRFNMVPLHPENLFIDDISFSLLWSRSF